MVIDIGSILSDVISGLILAGVTAIVGALFVNKYSARIRFSMQMKNLGFEGSSIRKQSKVELIEMCEKAEEIKIINVSGFHYLNDNELYLKRALAHGARVKFLCTDPSSIFLEDIERMERSNYQRSADSKISTEILDLIEKYKTSGIEIRFFSTEYRLPYILAYYRDGSVHAWLTVTLPPYKSTESFILRGVKSKRAAPETGGFVDMMETNFDTIWKNCSKSLEETL